MKTTGGRIAEILLVTLAVIALVELAALILIIIPYHFYLILK